MAGERDDEAFGTTVVTPNEAPIKVDLDAVKLDVTSFGERYTTVRPLARGGMGEVRLVRDESIGREVAVKVMTPERELSLEMRARFLREARVQGQLEHPAIVPVYDIGRDENGHEFFTMRRLNGWTLEQILSRLVSGSEQEEQNWSQQKLLGAFQQVCLAIDYAHKHGVVHRDLKPANIMLGEFGEVYVLDWGLAKLREVRTADSITEAAAGSSPTSEGQLLGTPGFMSPEQAAGEADVDERSDIYALGAILFEILALEPLHKGKTSKAVLRSTHVGADAKVSERAPERGVAPEFDAICAKATALEENDRHQSARELHAVVQRVLDGERDVSLREQLADKHAGAARAALDRALAADEGEMQHRSDALNEVGQALALAPHNREVAGILVTLLTSPPSALPDDAILEDETAARLESRSLNLMATVVISAFGLMLAVIPLWVGVKDWTWIGALGLPMVFAAAFAFREHRRSRSRQGLTSLFSGAMVTVFAAIAVGVSCGFLGPYFLTPSAAVLVAVIAAAASRLGQIRWLALVLACLAIAVPAALGWLGVFPTFYSFTEDTLTIHSLILFFHPDKTPISLLIVNLSLVIIPTLVVWHLVDMTGRLRRELLVRKWHLQQLVPQTSLEQS